MAAAIPTDTTASSAISRTTTDASGNTVTIVPSSVTSEITTTSDGVVYTITQIVHNPPGSLNSGSASGSNSSNAFFANKGAVAGTFVVVGLVIVGIAFAIGVLCFRRRRRQRLDREITAAAVAASSTGNAQRSPLDEGEDMHSSGPTNESYPSTVNNPMAQYNNYGATYGPAGGYDPFASTSAGYSGALAGASAAGAGGYAGYHPAGPSGYEGVNQEGDEGYYYDPREAGQYGTGSHGYEDAYGDYGEDEGKSGTPPGERPNPLHVSGVSGR